MARLMRTPSGSGNGPRVKALRERFAFQQLHGDEKIAPLLADFIELANVRMIDRRSRPGFAPKAFASFVGVAVSRIILIAVGRSSRSS